VRKPRILGQLSRCAFATPSAVPPITSLNPLKSPAVGKYPSDAKRAHIEGRVVLVATISVFGKVEDLCVSQGPEMLRQAAFDAVKTWKYKPFEVNGQPVEVKTQMNVDFPRP
jgi:TonB family protein